MSRTHSTSSLRDLRAALASLALVTSVFMVLSLSACGVVPVHASPATESSCKTMAMAKFEQFASDASSSILHGPEAALLERKVFTFAGHPDGIGPADAAEFVASAPLSLTLILFSSEKDPGCFYVILPTGAIGPLLQDTFGGGVGA